MYQVYTHVLLSFVLQATIAADHYMNLFVWSGRAAENDNDSRDYLRQWLEERTKDRFPAPQLHMLTESDSMSRRFTSLLAPSHADPVDHQIAHFPQLSRLSADELTQLRAKFRFHDPEADPSFRQWFWDVSSASSTGGSGVSLCE